jgi:transcriptional regulator with XRE-family HTH domain
VLFRKCKGMRQEKIIFKNLGVRVRSLRERAGFSQSALADRAGIHKNYLGGIERGERNPAVRNLARIADALGIKVVDLFKL